MIFFPKISVFFAFFTVDILPNSLNIIGKMILLTLYLFSTLYSSPQPWYSHDLIFLPNRIYKLYKNKELYTWPIIPQSTRKKPTTSEFAQTCWQSIREYKNNILLKITKDYKKLWSSDQKYSPPPNSSATWHGSNSQFLTDFNTLWAFSKSWKVYKIKCQNSIFCH